MLRKISIENFYSIKDKQVLDLAVPSNAPDLPVFGIEKEISATRIPKVVSIFGANASGKTTVLRALGFLKWFLTESFNQPPTNNLPLLPFADSEGQHGISRFEVEFDSNLIEGGTPCVYRYSLEIRHDPGNKTPLKLEPRPVVESESLYFAPEGKFRRLFYREGEQIKDSPEFKVKVKDYPLQTFRDNVSVIPTLVQYNHAISKVFASVLDTVFTNVSILQKYDFSLNDTIEIYMSDSEVFKELNSKIRMLDLGIDEVVISTNNNHVPVPLFKHSGLNSELIFDLESQGTQKFFKLFPVISYTLETGGLLVLDEIDNDVHPALMPEIIGWFHDERTNPHNAQLIMACHNTSLLEHLEKEEIYFTEKTPDGRIQVFGLKDIAGVRRVDNYYKKYLGGVFGAVPNIG